MKSSNPSKPVPRRAGAPLVRCLVATLVLLSGAGCRSEYQDACDLICERDVECSRPELDLRRCKRACPEFAEEDHNNARAVTECFECWEATEGCGQQPCAMCRFVDRGDFPD